MKNYRSISETHKVKHIPLSGSSLHFSMLLKLFILTVIVKLAFN